MNEHSIFQEVDEDLQRKKMEAWWKQYGHYILGSALLIVLITALINGWQSYRIFSEQKMTHGLLALSEDKKLSAEEKMTRLESFARANVGASQGMMARFDAAAQALFGGKIEKAVSIYDALSADQSVEPVFRQMADLMAVQAQFDTGDPATLQTRLQPLIEGSAWQVTAQELAAHLALRAGDKNKARDLFKTIAANMDAPETIVQRAKDMMLSLGQGT